MLAHGGRIENICSVNSFSAAPTAVVYHVSKAAEAALTKSCAAAWAANGIYVNGIVPGYVATEGVAHLKERSEKMKKIIPIGREATPKEIGYVAVFLCSEKACEIMGVAVDVSGGTIM